MSSSTAPVSPASPPRPAHPVGGRSAWRPADFESDAGFSHLLTAGEIVELENAVEHTRSRGLATLDITRATFPLHSLADSLGVLRRDVVGGRGFAYLRGLPVDNYDVDTLTRMFWGISRHIGDPVPQNRNAHMIGHVIDIGTRDDDVTKRSTQTSAELQFHSDACDVVGLLCIRPAKTGGESMFVSATTVHDAIFAQDQRLWAALYQPFYVDRRGEVPAGKPQWFQMPIYSWHEGALCGYAPLRQYVESARRFPEVPQLIGERAEAFDLFLRTCNDSALAMRVPFQPGDIQFLNNVLAFHARTAYVDDDRPDMKRHLLRIWLSLTDGIALPPCFEDRWRSIERGTVRGGVNLPSLPAPVIPMEAETPAYG